jgi:hypothetical protein
MIREMNTKKTIEIALAVTGCMLIAVLFLCGLIREVYQYIYYTIGIQSTYISCAIISISIAALLGYLVFRNIKQ